MGRYMMPVFVTRPPQYARRENRRKDPDPLEDFLTNALYGMLTPDGRGMAERCAANVGCQKRCEPKGHCGAKEGCVQRRSPSPFQSLFRALVQRQPWLQLIDVSGYGPGDLSVKVDEGKFFIHARREIKLKGGDYELMERRRSVKIPDGVDTSAISCHLRPDGKLVVRAPYVEDEEPLTNHEASGQCCCEKEKECKKEEEDNETSIEQKKEMEKIEADKESSEGQGCSKSCDGEQTCVLSTCEIENETSDKDGAEAENSKVETDKITYQQKSEIGNDEKKKILSTSPVPFDDSSAHEPGPFSDESEHSENAEVAEITETSAGPKLFPFTDMIRVVGTEDKKHFEVKVNLEGFQPDDISVKCVVNELILDSRREWEATEGVESVQAFQRRFALPEAAKCDEAKAVLNDSGLMVITVPIAETGNAVHVPVMPAEE